MKGYWIATILLFAATLSGVAQKEGKRLAAMQTSYTSEYNLDYPSAIAALEKVYDKTDYILNIRLGWLHYASGNYKASENYYKNAVAVAPSSIEAKLGLTFPLAVAERDNDLIEIYKSILKLDASNSKANYWLAFLLNKKNDNTEALRYAERLIKLYPFDFDGNLLLAKIQVKLGNIKEAKSAVDSALLYNPQSQEALTIKKAL